MKWRGPDNVGFIFFRKSVEIYPPVTMHLAGLFNELESSTELAVTPSLELAKLALVTSKDEDEDSELGKTGTDSSNSTDATLVEEQSTAVGTERLNSGTKSVLGKRDRTEHVVDDQRDTPTEQNGRSSDAANESPISPQPQPPPLPPRKKQVPSDSVMMFGMSFLYNPWNTVIISLSGRQHDVAECMDNCLFQIEAAMLKVDDKVEKDEEPRIVKT